MSISTYEQLLTHQLQDLHSAGLQFGSALSKMRGQAPDGEIADLLTVRIEAIERYQERIADLAREYQFHTDGKQCAAADGIIRESRDIQNMETPEVRAAAMLAFLKRVNGYLCAALSTALGLAVTLGYDESAESIRECFDEEAESRAKLEGIQL